MVGSGRLNEEWYQVTNVNETAHKLNQFKSNQIRESEILYLSN